MERARKQDVVTSLHQAFTDANLVVVTHYLGITAADSTALRRRMRDANAKFRVTKNRLAQRALEGTAFVGLTDLFTGPTAIAFSDDPVAAAKAAVEFSKTNENLIVVGGALRETMLDADAVKNLASLPSLDELRGKLVGLLSTPASRVVGVLNAPGGQVARVLGAYGATGDD